jgi:hypothetical protein
LLWLPRPMWKLPKRSAPNCLPTYPGRLPSPKKDTQTQIRKGRGEAPKIIYNGRTMGCRQVSKC